MKYIDGYKYKVIVDTREKKSSVISYLERHKIPYTLEKLDVGDYSLYLEDDNGEMINCGDIFALERKATLDELIQNVARKEYKRRFINELQYAKNKGVQLELFIEDESWYSKVVAGNYFSQTPKRAIRGYLAYFQQTYNFSIIGINKKDSGAYVIDRLIYFAKDYISKRE